MPNRFPKCLQGLGLLPGLQVRIVMQNGALSNGTGGIPYVLTGSLVAEIDGRHHDDPVICPPAQVDVEVENGTEFLLVDLGATGTTILIPGSPATTITLTGIVAVNLNQIQIIAPVTPL